MKPLIVLISASLILLFALKIITGKPDLIFSARIGMSIMLLFTALGHFIFSEGMALMVPSIVPFKKQIVYFTGVIEIAAAIGLHIPKLRLVTAWLLIIFFILVFPANIRASLENINYQKATYNGNGLTYLWFRVPLQILFIVWVYISSIKYL
ncbi:DoxX family protein [Flavivirga aquimarina]|uniref:DoxX family protein n=1 Tax=Flavivirga aquimarina TaxID=2027862 RepID=A0ABT8WB30_9FLAO|nr:DoxX family protein [Flavivirga aquimarina]MDO5970334.1 DoxX family protein [Flavivirga aquimarina]